MWQCPHRPVRKSSKVPALPGQLPGMGCLGSELEGATAFDGQGLPCGPELPSGTPSGHRASYETQSNPQACAQCRFLQSPGWQLFAKGVDVAG